MTEFPPGTHWDIGKHIDVKKLDTAEKRVLGVLYAVEREFKIEELTTKQLVSLINDKLERTSPPSISVAISRARGKISSINRDGTVYHKIMPSGIGAIKTYLTEITPKEVRDFIIANEIVTNERGYIKNVVWQINGCYQDSYYDACFVMIRRLIETLIIELYESHQWEKEIVDSDQQYFSFSKLIEAALQKKEIKFGKTSKQDLKDIKKFGDIAAHNRRLKLRKPDVDKYSSSVRIIVEELISNRAQ